MKVKKRKGGRRRIAILVAVGAAGLAAGLIFFLIMGPRLLPPTPKIAGTVERVENLGTRDIPEKSRTAADVQSVTLYRIIYWTTGYAGLPVLASGLLVVPVDRIPSGVVSYQHGTVTDRHAVPSFATEGGEFAVICYFAGAGYIVAAADYVGLGISGGIHPYVLAQSTADAVIDMLKASYTHTTATLHILWPERLFLTGISQGGYSSVVAHRQLERRGDSRFTVAADAPIAGPYNLRDVSLPYILEGKSEQDSVFVAFVLNAYAVVYRKQLDTLFSEKYSGRVPGLFDGGHSLEDLMSRLPPRPRDMLISNFDSELKQGRAAWLAAALLENEPFDWTPRAPIRLYYGGADKIISPRDAPLAARRFRDRGGDVMAVSYGNYGHDQSFRALPPVRSWFISFDNADR